MRGQALQFERQQQHLKERRAFLFYSSAFLQLVGRESRGRNVHTPHSVIVLCVVS